MNLPKLEILTCSEGTAVYHLWLEAADAAFADHFPGAPLLPGVVQLYWALALARRAGLTEAETGPLFKVKFKRPIRPGDATLLQLDLARAGKELRFEYRTGGEVASSGCFDLA